MDELTQLQHVNAVVDTWATALARDRLEFVSRVRALNEAGFVIEFTPALVGVLDAIASPLVAKPIDAA